VFAVEENDPVAGFGMVEFAADATSSVKFMSPSPAIAVKLKEKSPAGVPSGSPPPLQ